MCDLEQNNNLEEQINEWILQQGIIQCSPEERMSDYFQQKKNQAIQELRKVSIESNNSTNDIINENNQKLVSSPGSVNLNLKLSPLLQQRQRRKNSETKTQQFQFNMEYISFSQDNDENQSIQN